MFSMFGMEDADRREIRIGPSFVEVEDSEYQEENCTAESD